MIKAVSATLDTDLREFSLFLRVQGVKHRINEEAGEQVVWVDGEREAEFVRLALRDWEFNRPTQTDDQRQPIRTLLPSPARMQHAAGRLFRESPVSVSLIIACLVVAVVSGLGVRADRVAFLFYPRIATDLLPLLGDLTTPAAIARSLTPMLLHFGELHLIFNMLWLWYFGRQLEPTHPLWLFVVVIVFTSFASNTTQYLYSGSSNFGGMSGVVYGLVGYTWIVHMGMPRSPLMLNNSMFVVFVIALIVMELVASSWIATAAHVGGLLMGVLLGIAVVVYYRVVLRRDLIGKHRQTNT